MNLVICLLCFLLMAAGAMRAQTFAPAPGPPCLDAKTLTKDELPVFGRILAAVEDLGGGYYAEAAHRYERVIPAIGKSEHAACLRWMAYDGYGQSLIATHKKKKAIEALNRAAAEAKSLMDAQRAATQQHLESAEQIK